MKPDLYTKIVLTVIALALVPIACNQYVHPATTAAAQGPLASVQFNGAASHFTLFDQRTGDVWSYDREGLDDKMVMRHTKVAAPGRPGETPLVVESQKR